MADSKRCIPCEGLTEALAVDQVAERAKTELPLWSFEAEPTPQLIRSFVGKNFQASMDFMVSAGKIAEAEGHHPDFHLTSYRNVRVGIYTHSVGGITDNDFVLAQKLDEIKVEYSPKWLKEHPEGKATAASAASLATGGSGTAAEKLVDLGDKSFFKAKTVLITGCSRGLGLGFATQLLDAGANVIASCRNPATASALQELLAKHKKEGSVFPLVVPIDVSKWESIDEAVKSLGAQLEGVPLDILINNAGIGTANHPIDPIVMSTKEDMLMCYETNVCGSMHMTQMALPLMEGSK
jgi:4a-hydroxytetrahydrobiopterin dehydratase